MIDKERGLEWSLRQAVKTDDGIWLTSFGAVSNLRGDGVAKPWMQEPDPLAAESAMPAGFPLIAGLIRVEEVKAGRIDHALLIATPAAQIDRFLPPASTAAAPGSVAALEHGLPLGSRLQLDPAFDVENSSLSETGKIIARALQTYGAYVGDTAGGNVLFAEASPEALSAWEVLLKPDDLQAVFSPDMMAKHFRVVDTGETMPGRAATAN
jgi:hypothetical protein